MLTAILLAMLLPAVAHGQNHFLDFDGTNDTVNLGGGINPGPNFTIEAWVYPKSLPGFMQVVSKSNGIDNPGDFQLRVENPSGQVTVNLYSSIGWNLFLTSGTLAVSTWTHVAYTADGSTLRFYFNGVQDPTTNAIAGTIGANTSPVHVGSWAIGVGNASHFHGLIDEVRIWNHARSATAIVNEMFTGLTGNEAGLLAYYSFDQGTCGGINPSETTLVDGSPNGLDGTLGSFALTGCTSNWVCGGPTCGLVDNGVVPATTTTTSSTTTTTIPSVGITGKKLIIVDKLTVATKAKIVYVAKDTTASKGTTNDPTQISATFDYQVPTLGTSGSAAMPSGASWLVNKATVAKYVNKSAPTGGAVKVGVIKPGKLLKAVLKDLGDPASTIDIYQGGSTVSSVDAATQFTVVDGTTTIRHCGEFTGCTRKLIAAGTGAKVVCKTAVAGASVVCP